MNPGGETKQRSFMRIFIALLLLLLISCSMIRITPGNETDRMKVETILSDDCKVRVKIKKQKISCKFKF